MPEPPTEASPLPDGIAASLLWVDWRFVSTHQVDPNRKEPPCPHTPPATEDATSEPASGR